EMRLVRQWYAHRQGHGSGQHRLPVLVRGAAAGLRALAAARRSLRCQLFASTCYVIGGLGGAAVAGTVGSAWGVAAATACGSVVWWLHLHRALREHRPSIREVRTP
ncbi:hypothetical protein ABZ726_36095, partial [Streptomyces hundungensis]